MSAAGRHAVWAAGLVVAAGAGAATAHGLYEVAASAGVPAAVAWLYPLITDGLALVAYSAAAGLTGPLRVHAWAVVVLAAGLSGLAQATYLAGAVRAAPVALRFGVGAWPAIAGALAAHLLHLLGPDSTRTDPEPVRHTETDPVRPSAPALPPVRDSAAPLDPAVTSPPGPAAPQAVAKGRRAGRAPARAGRSDAELLAELAAHAGPLSVRAAARELGCGVDRARRLLTQAGLRPEQANPTTRQEEYQTSTDEGPTTEGPHDH